MILNPRAKVQLLGNYFQIHQLLKLLIFDHSEIPLMQKGRGVTLQKFKSGKTLSGICFNSKEGILNENNGKTLLAANEIKKWLGKRAQAGKIEPKSLHSKI